MIFWYDFISVIIFLILLFLFNASVCAILVNTTGGLEQFLGIATQCIQSETMKLLWSSQQKFDKDKKSENV